jgi:hypothetical protein
VVILKISISHRARKMKSSLTSSTFTDSDI